MASSAASGGWIGKKIKTYIDKRGGEMVAGVARVDNQANVLAEVEKHEPDQILSVLGRTQGSGFSIIDYLEQKGQTRINIRDTIYDPFVLANIAELKGIHYTYLGTGCISSSDSGDVSFDEMLQPNFFGIRVLDRKRFHRSEESSSSRYAELPDSYANQPGQFAAKLHNKNHHMQEDSQRVQFHDSPRGVVADDA
jgi:hypothetical protein